MILRLRLVSGSDCGFNNVGANSCSYLKLLLIALPSFIHGSSPSEVEPGRIAAVGSAGVTSPSGSRSPPHPISRENSLPAIQSALSPNPSTSVAQKKVRKGCPQIWPFVPSALVPIAPIDRFSGPISSPSPPMRRVASRCTRAGRSRLPCRPRSKGLWPSLPPSSQCRRAESRRMEARSESLPFKCLMKALPVD